MKIKISEGKANIFTPYNAEFVKRIKSIGGAKWNGAEKCWKIPAEAVDAARDIMMDVYGETDIPDGSEKLKLRITALVDIEELRAPVSYFGKNLASASGRDSGARVGDGVILESGTITSSGSMKNWTSMIRKDAVMILTDVPETLYQRDKNATTQWGDTLFSVEVLKNSVDKEKLESEKAALLARIAEIDRILAQ